MNLASYKARSTSLYRDIEAALEKNGFKPGKFSASIDSATGAVRLTLNFSDVNSEDPAALFFKQNADLLGMKPNWLGKTFSMSGRNFKVVGLKPRGEKCVIVTEGKTAFVVKPEAVIAAMAR